MTTMARDETWANARGLDEYGNYVHAVGGQGYIGLDAVQRSQLIARAPKMRAALSDIHAMAMEAHDCDGLSPCLLCDIINAVRVAVG